MLITSASLTLSLEIPLVSQVFVSLVVIVCVFLDTLCLPPIVFHSYYTFIHRIVENYCINYLSLSTLLSVAYQRLSSFVFIYILTMSNYQLQVQINGVGTPIDTTWPPRSYRAASKLANYYTRRFPANTYWLRPVD